MSDFTTITDFHDLRKLVDAGTLILQVATTDESTWGDDKRKVTTTIGTVYSVEIIERGGTSRTAAIWMKGRPEPIFLIAPGPDDPAVALSFRILSGGYI